MGKLTTHVLDTASGKPGAGIGIKLYRIEKSRQLVASATTNTDGRTDKPLLHGDAFVSGIYELEFSIGDYFRRVGTTDSDDSFLEEVIIRVNLASAETYHVPLLASPWSYSTYRGS